MEKEKTCSNTHPCECPGTNCARRGTCCDCVAHHKKRGGLPVCLRGLQK